MKIWPTDCTATIDTVPFGIVQCHRQDGRRHPGRHHYDHIENGRLRARVDWSDHYSGYGVTPSYRLTPGATIHDAERRDR